jgi:hypothetical protein
VNCLSDKDDFLLFARGIQDWHISGNGWCDIGYSFLVGGDGNVYEGRGWDEIGAHTGGFNSVVSEDKKVIIDSAHLN